MEKSIEDKLNFILAFSHEKAYESDYTPCVGLKFLAGKTEGLADIQLFGRAFFLDTHAVRNPKAWEKINRIYQMLMKIKMEEKMDKEMRYSVLAELDRLPFLKSGKYYVWDGFSCFFLKKDNGDYVLCLHETLHSLGEDSPLNIRLAYNLLGLNERKAVEEKGKEIERLQKKNSELFDECIHRQRADGVGRSLYDLIILAHENGVPMITKSTMLLNGSPNQIPVYTWASTTHENPITHIIDLLAQRDSERVKNSSLVEALDNFTKAVKRTVPDYHGFVKEMVKVEQVLLANKAIRNNEGTISEADKEMRESTLAELPEIEEVHKLYQQEIHLMRLKHQTEIDCMRERTINQETLSERRRKRMVDVESQHRDLLIQWSEERTKVVNALREVSEAEARNVLLVEALSGIKAEFQRLKTNAKTLYDAVYLEGVLAVIEAKSNKVIVANKGEINE